MTIIHDSLQGKQFSINNSIRTWIGPILKLNYVSKILDDKLFAFDHSYNNTSIIETNTQFKGL